MTTPTSTPVSSVAPPPSSDNQFQLTDHDKKTTVTLRLGSSGPPIAGHDANGPTMDYQGADGSHTFTGQEIVSETTSLGQMYTVTLNIVPDLRTLAFTLVLPPVTHKAGSSSQAFDTIAIRSERHRTLIGPLPPGADTTYTVVKMHGTAKKLEIAS